MSHHKYQQKLKRLQELVITTFLGDIPTIALGPRLRRFIYRYIFNRIGQQVYIQHGVEFIGTSCIELDDGVNIFKHVRLDGKGHPKNRIYIGKKVAIERHVDIGCLENTQIYIDEETFIGPNVSLSGPGNIFIGKHCMIAANSGIFANNHQFSDHQSLIKDQGITRQGIVIEDNCWLGHGVTVLDGVTIGKGSVIGAGAVVSKDIPPFSVAVGVPARVIKHRLPQAQMVKPEPSL
jgi:acetyltransferase-like isoleucine patch superfamily enzyme